MKQFLLLILCLVSLSSVAQRFRWAQGASYNGSGGNGMAYYRSATDKHGNVYVTGYFTGTANFGSGASGSVVSYGGQDIFLAKYDTTGALVWLTSAGSTGNDYGYSCAVDSADNCYLVGTFSGTCNYGNGKIMTAWGNTDGFLAKYNKNGACLWVNRFGSGSYEYANGVDCSPNGTVYVTGTFTNQCQFLSQTSPLSNTCVQASGSNYDIFLAKYNSSGVLSWVRSAGTGQWAYSWDVSVDDSANAYITGYYYGTVTFDNKIWQGSLCGIGAISPTVSIALSSGTNSYHGFIAKFSATGVPKWAINCPGGNTYGYAYSIGGDGFGNLFVTGYYSGTGIFGSISLSASTSGYGTFVAKLNTNGDFEWARNIQNNSNTWAWGYDVCANASGACFVTGYTYTNFTTTGYICSTPFPANNQSWGYHTYGVKFKANGDCAWSVRGSSQNGTNSWAYGYGISVNDFGSIYMTGYNQPNLKFYLNADTATSYGNVNGSSWGTYLAHFEDDNFILIDKTKATYCPGDSFYLKYDAYGVYADSNIFRAMISDGNGGWQAYQYVGQKVGSNHDSILVKIPKNLPNGLGYRFRVEASAPLVRSNKSLNDAAIVRPVANILNPDDTLCLGDSLQLNCDPAYKYLWYSNFSIRDSTVRKPYISPPATTKIYLRTLNLAGCENFDSIRIVVIARPIPNAGRDTSVCIGDSLQLQATGGKIYRWYPAVGLSDSTIANPKVLLNAASRTYHVIVGNGFCVEEDSVILTGRTPLQITGYNDTTICKGQSTVLHANPIGGYSPGYTLSWSNGVGTGNYLFVTPSTTTTYRVVLSDGCTILNDTEYITITVRPKLTVTPRLDTTICKGQSVMLYANGSGGYSPDYTFSWSNNAGNGKQVMVSPQATTTYKVLLRDNCTSQNDSAIVTVFVRGDLDVNASNDTTICIGQSAALHILNTTGGDNLNYHYDWYNSSNLLISNNAICNVSPVITSNYYVVVTDNCTSKTDTDYVTVFVRNKLDVTAMADTTICKGTATLLKVKTATGGYAPNYTYSWYDATFNLVGTGAQTLSPIINSPSKFYIVLRDNCTSVTDTDEVEIFHHAPLKITARIDSIICIGQAVYLYGKAQGGDSLHYNYKWLDSTTNALVGYGNYLSVVPSSTTTYKVVLSDNCTPKTDTDYVKIKHRPALVIKFPKDTTICRGNSVDLFVDGSGGDSTSYEFKWNNGAGSGRSTKVTPLVTASYKVVLTDFCTLKSDSAIIKVTVLDPLKINAGADKNICYGQFTTITPPLTTGGKPSGYGYVWYNLSTNTIAGTTKSLTVNPLATTTYRVVFTDNCTVAKDSDEVVVVVQPTLKIKIISPSVTVCRGTNISLQSQGSGGYDATLFQYKWSQNLGNKANINFAPDSTRYYKVTLSDGCSLPVSDSILINVEQLPQPQFTVIDSIGCNPFTVKFIDASSNNANNKYLWYFGDGSQDTIPNPTHTYNKVGKYKVELRLTSPTGCTNIISKPDYIVSNITPIAKFNSNPVKVKASDGSVYFTNQSSYSDSLQVQYGDGQQLSWTAKNQWFHKYTDTGVYIVQLTVKNKFNCTASAFDTIVVEEDYNYFMPNIFSPNNDGNNETLKPSLTFVDHYTMKVYDRWGTLVYKSPDQHCDAKQTCGWDGMFRGEPAPEAVYIYQIYILDKDFNEHYEKGTFILVR